MGLTSLKISFSEKHLFFQHLRYYYIYTKTTIMETSIFMHKEKKPAVAELKSALGEKHQLWQEIRDFVFENPVAVEEWNFPGKKYGWSYRIKDKKRAIIYLLPREGFFKVAFVFGQKATNFILAENISDTIKTELNNARVYAEGRGIQIEIREHSNLRDVKKLIEIKLAF